MFKINYRTKNFLFLILFTLAIVLLGVGLVYSNGAAVKSLLFFDKKDYFMDFFNPIADMYKGNIYTSLYGVYPPFAYSIFWLMSLLIPDKLILAGAFIIRANRGGILLYLLFVVFTSTILFIQITSFKLGTKAQKMVFGFLMMLSAPFLYNFDRGNIIVLPLIFLLFFFMYKDSKNKWVREGALLALALSAGIKLYPVIFFVILLKAKRYKDLFRAGFYLLCIFFIPFVFFGGLDGLINMLMNIQRLSGIISKDANFRYNLSLFNSFNFINTYWNLGIKESLMAGVYGLALLGIGFSCFMKSNWKTIALLTCLMIGVPNFSYSYAGMFTIIPAILFLNDPSDMTKLDWVYFGLFLLQLVPFVFWVNQVVNSNGRILLISANSFVAGFALLLMTLILMIEFIISRFIKQPYKAS